ncbi:hypothetical protein SteCoe_929 [Stentor coeruleus]|uniref:Uncharacterized protein n=1 Tax=Stentor coeruleus TaxID=5963 RepID=A0A1R2D333_9CILI|nr:hypothetical protein SteCoe_929 [Stentor coeruleus]
MLTAKSHAGDNLWDSIPNDKESLENQLDRLNKLIQNITSRQFSPDLPIICRSPSQDSFTEYSSKSLYETGESYIETLSEIEAVCEAERFMMKNEDFRSHEDRKNCSIQTQSDNMIAIFDVTLDDLGKLINDINNIRTSSEKSSIDNIVNISGKQVVFRIRDRGKFFISKDILSYNFTESKINQIVPKNIENNREDFKSEIEEKMMQSFNESFPFTLYQDPSFQKAPKPLWTKSYTNSIDFSYTEISLAKNRKTEYLKIIEKLQWQCNEIIMVKENYQKKFKKLHEHEKRIREKNNEILQEESRMKSQKIIIAKDLEIIQQQKKLLEQYKEDNRKKLEIIKNTLAEVRKNANFIIKPISTPKTQTEKKKSEESIVLKPRRYEHKFESEQELQSLSQEIKELENLLSTVPENAEHIKTRLDRLKTKESNIKSKRVITASLERSNSMSSKLSILDKERNKTPLKPSQSKPVFDTKPLKSSNNINTQNFPSEKKQSFISPKKILTKTNENPDDFQKYLKLRECRLIEKEEELSKRENILYNNLSKNIENIGLVGIVQNEQRNLKILRNDLEKRQKILEKEVLTHSRKRSELKAKERDVLNAIESFDAFTYQKKHLENRLQLLISVFEDLS